MSSITADEALALLRAGNRDFLNDAPSRAPTDRETRLRLASGQRPFAAYVSCSDSRVPPELLFGRGLGELFIVRNAGNTLDTTALGSLEFAVAVLEVPLIVVMGHEACGAVDAAMTVVRDNFRYPGNIGKMIEPIIPAVLEARRDAPDDLTAAVRQNVRRVTRQLREESSPLLLNPQAEGKLKVVGAYYHLSSGEVDFFDL
jgi:carbonic anhydrase